MNPVALLYAVIGISFLVVIHELGHYLFAKLFNVYVFEFSIGMGPKLFSKRKGETDYSIRAFPIGGFVSMAGENLDEFLPEEKYIDEVTGEEKTRTLEIPAERTINGLNNFKKFLVISAGVVFNFILCFILLVVVFLVDGIPTAPNETRNIRIQPNSSASEAGLVKDDTVVKISGILYASENSDVIVKEVTERDYTSYSTLSEVLDELTPTTKEPGQRQCITLTLQRDLNNPVEVCRTISEVLEVKEGTETKYYATKPLYGISVGREPASFSQAVSTALYYEGQMTISIFSIFDNLENVGGPVAIYSYVEASVASGFIDFVWLLALLSANLGIVNLLPIPGLDGGRLVMIIGETITRKKFPRKAEAIINTVGMFLLFGLMILITFKDIIGLF